MSSSFGVLCSVCTVGAKTRPPPRAAGVGSRLTAVLLAFGKEDETKNPIQGKAALRMFDSGAFRILFFEFDPLYSIFCLTDRKTIAGPWCVVLASWDGPVSVPPKSPRSKGPSGQREQRVVGRPVGYQQSSLEERGREIFQDAIHVKFRSTLKKSPSLTE